MSRFAKITKSLHRWMDRQNELKGLLGDDYACPVGRMLLAHHNGDRSAKARIRQWHAKFRPEWAKCFSPYMSKKAAGEMIDHNLETCIQRFNPKRQPYNLFAAYVTSSILGRLASARANYVRTMRGRAS